MISYIHRNTKMVLLFNRDLKPTFKRSSFVIWFDQRNLKPSGAEETKMALQSQGKGKYNTR
ncbi:hypothetical protein HanRHA438_Chr15g0728791 [Helianthus annuus]|uniref:Uncharacterized protein n=1 Tax=Helianthus annuus TaxID=4232 RepID=A0A251SDB2_HELAN|nr:hypothetical protein HanXRQr2_Chr15g0716561 [Helianthus annuus]KAJ0452904.1 hypothetical protein HanHA300_Chr15g0584301 [Helianthus annuus]KAJ0474819.1 hypothetical protein HanHA89_Chr15g0634091 [Helianthus annuus]KAJ0650374.1 hypothetical protein HanLR1_Chr15g0595011 [Helianthus annuus]KAJ0654142.1 hypothetical protein HanOQP8_Chr15g0591581 [Helianthus annuus]